MVDCVSDFNIKIRGIQNIASDQYLIAGQNIYLKQTLAKLFYRCSRIENFEIYENSIEQFHIIKNTLGNVQVLELHVIKQQRFNSNHGCVFFTTNGFFILLYSSFSFANIISFCSIIYLSVMISEFIRAHSVQKLRISFELNSIDWEITKQGLAW